MALMLRYGIVGSGQMGSEHILSLRALGKEVTITAVAEPEPRMRDFARAFLGDMEVQFFDDHISLRDSGLCDVVVISSPNFTHAPILKDLIGSEVHILVEKPLAISTAQALEIKTLSARHRKVLWVGLEYRYIPAVKRALELLDEGFVGEVKMVSIVEHRYPFLPKVNHWNRFNRYSGGTLIEKCCHFFDLMNLIADSTPVRVYASGSQALNHLDEVYEEGVPDVLDNAFVIVDYENGVRASLDLCMFAEASEDEQRISVVGSEGKIEAHVPSQEVVYGKRKEKRAGLKREVLEVNDVPYVGFHWGATFREHVALKEAILRGLDASVTVDSGLLSVAVGEAAQLSIERGVPVYLSELLPAPST